MCSVASTLCCNRTLPVCAGYIHVLLLALIHSLVGVRYCSSWNVLGYVFAQVSGTVLSCTFLSTIQSFLPLVIYQKLYLHFVTQLKEIAFSTPPRSPDVNLPPAVDREKNGDHEPQNNAVEDTSTVQNVIDVSLKGLTILVTGYVVTELILGTSIR